MKELMIKTLNDVYNNLINTHMNETHKERCSDIIDEITVSQFKQFCIDNEIPDNAIISASCDYDGDYYATIYWYKYVPNKPDDKAKYIKTKFEEKAFDAMHIALLNNGYVSRNFPCNVQSKYNVYNWYMEKNWEELEHYYLIFFKKL